jgi:LAO/AO transport system kinase
VKSGVLEIADVFVVNKADRDGADRAALELEQRLELGRVVSAREASAHAWRVPVLKCVALRDAGLPELMQALAEHRAWLDTPPGALRRSERARKSAERLVFSLIREELAGAIEVELGRAAARVAERELTPHAAAAELVTLLREKLSAS